MTNFEKITASPEALGAFLASLPVASGPWDDEFHKTFCTDCLYLGCDNCPHEEERDRPMRWLRLGEETETAKNTENGMERKGENPRAENGTRVISDGWVVTDDGVEK